jgi:hypothetical protein
LQPPHKVNLTDMQKTVLVQLVKSSAGLSVIEGYKDLSKFNLRELGTHESGEEEEGTAEAASEPETGKEEGGAANSGEGGIVAAAGEVTGAGKGETAVEVPKEQDAGTG